MLINLYPRAVPLDVTIMMIMIMIIMDNDIASSGPRLLVDDYMLVRHYPRIMIMIMMQSGKHNGKKTLPIMIMISTNDNKNDNNDNKY